MHNKYAKGKKNIQISTKQKNKQNVCTNLQATKQIVKHFFFIYLSEQSRNTQTNPQTNRKAH